MKATAPFEPRPDEAMTLGHARRVLAREAEACRENVAFNVANKIPDDRGDTAWYLECAQAYEAVEQAITNYEEMLGPSDA